MSALSKKNKPGLIWLNSVLTATGASILSERQQTDKVCHVKFCGHIQFGIDFWPGISVGACEAMDLTLLLSAQSLLQENVGTANVNGGNGQRCGLGCC